MISLRKNKWYDSRDYECSCKLIEYVTDDKSMVRVQLLDGPVVVMRSEDLLERTNKPLVPYDN